MGEPVREPAGRIEARDPQEHHPDPLCAGARVHAREHDRYEARGPTLSHLQEHLAGKETATTDRNRMTDVKIAYWDTEFTPNLGHFWGLWDQNISYDFVNETQRMLCFGFKEKGKRTVVVDERVGRLEMLTQLRDYLNDVDILVSWNGTSYDTKMANREFLKAGLTPPAPYKELDLMRVVKARFKFASNKHGGF
jgi:hypothetical protein